MSVEQVVDTSQVQEVIVKPVKLMSWLLELVEFINVSFPELFLLSFFFIIIIIFYNIFNMAIQILTKIWIKKEKEKKIILMKNRIKYYNYNKRVESKNKIYNYSKNISEIYSIYKRLVLKLKNKGDIDYYKNIIKTFNLKINDNLKYIKIKNFNYNMNINIKNINLFIIFNMLKREFKEYQNLGYKNWNIMIKNIKYFLHLEKMWHKTSKNHLFLKEDYVYEDVKNVELSKLKNHYFNIDFKDDLKKNLIYKNLLQKDYELTNNNAFIYQKYLNILNSKNDWIYPYDTIDYKIIKNKVKRELVKLDYNIPTSDWFEYAEVYIID